MMSEDPEIEEIKAERRQRRAAAERERQLAERDPLLVEVRAAEDEDRALSKDRAEVSRLERIAAEARAEWLEHANALQMRENRLAGIRQRLYGALSERPSEAQRVALAEMDTEIAEARERRVDPSIAHDFADWVRALLNARDNIAGLAATPDEEHPSRIAAIRRAIPPCPEGVKVSPPRDRHADLADYARESLAQIKAHGVIESTRRLLGFGA